MRNDAQPGRAARRGARAALCCAAALAVAAGLSSCAPPVLVASAGVQAFTAGAGAFANGELRAAWLVPLEDLWPAANDTVRALEFVVEDARLEPEDRIAEGEPARKGLIFAEDGTGRTVEFFLVAVTPSVTRLSIRVGVFGDEAVSRLILRRLEQEVEARLGPVDGTVEND